LLDTRQLYFAHLDQFDDPYEGSIWPLKIVKQEFKHQNISREDKEDIKNNFKDYNKYLAINCWHINEHESHAMWKLYSGINKGIAIQSTIGRLKRIIKNSKSKYEINIFKVKYLDWETEGRRAMPTY